MTKALRAIKAIGFFFISLLIYSCIHTIKLKYSSNPSIKHVEMSTGFRNVGYFTNWGIYGRDYQVENIPAAYLTHLLYAFADVDAATGRVKLSDSWADEQKPGNGDPYDDSGRNLYGNLKQIYHLKQRNRHLKLIMSIGGWTYSPNFHAMVVDPSMRSTFVQSAIQILQDYALDGLDIDYEYPGNAEQAWGYVELLRELRTALDALHPNNNPYELTIAAPCGASTYEILYVGEMDKYLSFWNLMTYDFSGSWDSHTAHQSNLRGQPMSVETAVNWYRSRGVAGDKLVVVSGVILDRSHSSHSFHTRVCRCMVAASLALTASVTPSKA